MTAERAHPGLDAVGEERGRWIAELLDTARANLARVERYDRRVDAELVREAGDALRHAHDLMVDHRKAAGL